MKNIVLNCFVLFVIFTFRVMGQTSLCPEIFVQTGHSSKITSIALSENGRYALTGSYDKTVKLWDIQTGLEIQTFNKHKDEVCFLSFFDNDKKAITIGGFNDSILIWDIQSGSLLKQIPKFYDYSIGGFRISNNEKYFITSQKSLIGEAIAIYNTSTGEIVSTIKSQYSKVVAISHDETKILVAGIDEPYRLYDIATGSLIKSIGEKGSGIAALEFSLDDKFFYSCNKSDLMKWEIATGICVAKSQPNSNGYVTQIRLTPDGKTVITSSEDVFMNTEKSIAISNSQTLEIEKKWKVKDDILIIALSNDGSSILTSGKENTATYWNLKTGELILDLKGKPVYSVLKSAISPNSKFIASSHYSRNLGNKLIIWDKQSGKLLYSLLNNSEKPLYENIKALVFSPDGKYLLTGNFNGVVNYWSTQTWSVERTIVAHKKAINGLVISDDGKSIATSSADGFVNIFNYETGELIKSIPVPAYGDFSISFTHDGKRVAIDKSKSTSSDGFIQVWDIDKVQKLWEITAMWVNYDAVSFSNDDKLLFAGRFGVVDGFNANTGKFLDPYMTFKGHDGWVYDIKISTDGKHLITAGDDKTIRIYDVATQNEILKITGHKAQVNSISLAPDGRSIISSGADGSIRFWETSTGKELASLHVFDQNEWVTMTPQGYFNASSQGGKNISVRIGCKVYSIDNLFETYFRPDIVSSQIALKSFTQTTQVDINRGFKTPPDIALQVMATNDSYIPFNLIESSKIKIENGSCKVKVVATNTGGGISSIRLFNNKKVIGENQRGFKVVKQNDRFEQEFSVPLTEGDNTISSTAFSDDMTESNPINTVISYKPVQVAKPDMYVLAIGINEYRNAKYNLNYCVNDANGFVGSITAPAQRLFANVNSTIIQNRDASRTNVVKAFDDIKSRIKPQDVFVFFYAGHGIALDITDENGSPKSEFFYVLTDVTQMTNEAKCSSEGLSGKELKALLTDIKANKQILFVDACNSGAFAQAFAARGAAEENALAKLSRASGAAIIASTTKEQFATEFQTLQHGAFTYVLLEALKGDAALANGQLTAKSIMTWVEDKIPEITLKYKGEEQFPTTFIWGQDFPVGIVK